MDRCKIFQFLTGYLLEQQGEPPQNVDWTTACTQELHKRVELVDRGDIHEIRYYSDVECTDPVVRRRFEIEYAPGEVLVTERIQWCLESGAWHPVEKVLRRVYSGQRWLDWMEGKRRQTIEWLRYNVAATLLEALPVAGLESYRDVMEEGARFFAGHALAISGYVAGNSPALASAVKSDKREWLDLPWPKSKLTVRGKFLEQIDGDS